MSHSNMKSFAVESAAATEVLTKTEVKAHLRVDDSNSAENTWFDDRISAATELAEETMGQRLITQTWDTFADRFDGQEIIIPYPPLISVTDVFTTGLDNTETTMSSSDYWVNTATKPGRVVLDDTATWPADIRTTQGIRVRHVSGYGAASAVPWQIKRIMLDLIAFWDSEREGGPMEREGRAPEAPTLDNVMKRFGALRFEVY